MRRRRVGRPLHDPARHDPAFSRRRPASGNGPTRVHGDYRRRQGRDEPRAGPARPRRGATKRPVRIHLRVSQRRSRHRRHRPQFEIPIAVDCGPRVPSSGTFVRLPAPETLHDSGPAASGISRASSGRSSRRRWYLGLGANLSFLDATVSLGGKFATEPCCQYYSEHGSKRA